MEVRKASFEAQEAPTLKAKGKPGSFLPFLEKADVALPLRKSGVARVDPRLAAARSQARKISGKPVEAKEEQPQSQVEEETMPKTEAGNASAEGEEAKEDDPCKALFVSADPENALGEIAALAVVLSFFGVKAETGASEETQEALVPVEEASLQAPKEAMLMAEATSLEAGDELSLEPVGEPIGVQAPIVPGKPQKAAPMAAEQTEELAASATVLPSRPQPEEPTDRVIAVPIEAAELVAQAPKSESPESESQEGGSQDGQLGEAAKAAQALAFREAEKASFAEAFEVERVEVSPADIARQIMGQARTREIAPGVSEARIALHPESLGEVVLSVKSDNGVIAAHFVATDPRVKEILENSLSQLRVALADQGLGVSQLSVSVGGEREQAQENGRRRQGRFLQEAEADQEAEEEKPIFDGRMNLAI
jgi:flagellar hook-length control protein FliK